MNLKQIDHTHTHTFVDTRSLSHSSHLHRSSLSSLSLCWSLLCLDVSKSYDNKEKECYKKVLKVLMQLLKGSPWWRNRSRHQISVNSRVLGRSEQLSQRSETGAGINSQLRIHFGSNPPCGTTQTSLWMTDTRQFNLNLISPPMRSLIRITCSSAEHAHWCRSWWSSFRADTFAP